MAKKHLTNLQQQYKKQQQRLRKGIKRYAKRGYIISDEKLTTVPKKVTTKMLQKLTATKPSDLLKKSEYVNFETGETYSGKQRQQEEKAEAKEKARRTRQRNKEQKTYEAPQLTTSFQPPSTVSETQPPSITPTDSQSFNYDRVAIYNFRSQVKTFPNGKMGDILLSWIDQIERDNGTEATVKMLEDGMANGLIVTWRVVYDEEACFEYMSDMLNYLEDQGLIYKEDVIQMMQELEYSESVD